MDLNDVLSSPYALAAPCALFALVLISRWFVREGASRSSSLGSMLVIGTIIAGAFVWIYLGIGFIGHRILN
jgi:hypothetical protein